MGIRREEPSQQTLDELVIALAVCRRLLPILNELKNTQPGMGPSQSNIGRHKPESKEPWASAAAHAHFSIYFDSRILADLMRVDIGIGTWPWRNGEDGLDQIESAAPLVTSRVLGVALRQTEHWVQAGLRIHEIDLEDSWTPVPRTPGQPPTFCPFCSTLSLRVNPRRGLIRCFFPGCTDTDGRATRARMEYSPAFGQGILVFDDGTTVECRTDRIEATECTQIK